MLFNGGASSIQAEGSALRALVALCGSCVLLWLMAGAAVPGPLLRDIVLLPVPVCLLLICAVTPIRSPQPKEFRDYLFWSGAFVLLGLLYALLSFGNVFSGFADLPVRQNYILRQSYFLFLWIPLAIGAYKIWCCLLPGFVAFVRHWGLVILVVMATADLLTSIFIANPIAIEWVGYASFFEKFSFAYGFVLVFTVYCAVAPTIIPPFALLVTYFALSKLSGYGIMFNALTGLVMFGILAVSAMRLLHPLLRARAVLLIYLAALIVCLVGVLRPEYSGGGDSLWRAMAWRENISSLRESDLVGVGFGTPYFRITENNLTNALMNRWLEPVEPQYFRTQHSSVINVFYRLGVGGGSLLLWLNIIVVCTAYRLIKRGASQLGLVALTVLVCQLFQGTVHVGIETPRYLFIYMLATGFVFAATSTWKTGAFPPSEPVVHGSPAGRGGLRPA